jgi:hypothetical protein
VTWLILPPVLCTGNWLHRRGLMLFWRDRGLTGDVKKTAGGLSDLVSLKNYQIRVWWCFYVTHSDSVRQSPVGSSSVNCNWGRASQQSGTPLSFCWSLVGFSIFRRGGLVPVIFGSRYLKSVAVGLQVCVRPEYWKCKASPPTSKLHSSAFIVER